MSRPGNQPNRYIQQLLNRAQGVVLPQHLRPSGWRALRTEADAIDPFETVAEESPATTASVHFGDRSGQETPAQELRHQPAPASAPIDKSAGSVDSVQAMDTKSETHSMVQPRFAEIVPRLSRPSPQNGLLEKIGEASNNSSRPVLSRAENIQPTPLGPNRKLPELDSAKEQASEKENVTPANIPGLPMAAPINSFKATMTEKVTERIEKFTSEIKHLKPETQKTRAETKPAAHPGQPRPIRLQPARPQNSQPSTRQAESGPRLVIHRLRVEVIPTPAAAPANRTTVIRQASGPGQARRQNPAAANAFGLGQQ